MVDLGRVNVSQQGVQAFQRMDTSKDGKITLNELKASADKDGDGKVGLQEAAGLEKELGRYLDKDMASKLAIASMGFEPIEFSFGPKAEPAAAAEGAAPAQAAGNPRTIPGKLDNARQDEVEISDSPAGPPTVLRPKTDGQPLSLTLGNNVKMGAWPPEPVKFKDPETGKEVSGFSIKFSTGDEILVPQGQPVTLVKPQEKQPGQVVIGGQTQYYRLGADGKATNDVMTMRYATVFCTRGF